MSRETTLAEAAARYAVFFALSLAVHLVVCLGGQPTAAQDLLRAAREAALGPGEVRRP